MRRVLTFILAGGKGERLNPLTRDRAKPAVPFGGIYRIVDFTLSNCVNSGLRQVYVLIQYKSFSLQKHILAGWNEIVSSQLGEFIDLVPAQQRISSDWYKGTADAIYQNIYAIKDVDPELVLVLAGDHIYKMNYQDMIGYHSESQADMTVACVPMPAHTAHHFGVIEVNAQNEVCGFQEKPKNPKVIPGDPTRIFASMGIYLFKEKVLLEALGIDAKNPLSSHDFGKDVIPQMLKNNRKIFVYNFVDKSNQPHYWRDIGTRDAYYLANMDLIKPKPEFNLYDRTWPVRTYHAQYPPSILMNSKDETGVGEPGCIVNSLISGGSIIRGAHIHGTIISPNVRIEPLARIENSIIMESVVIGRGAKINNAIIDKEVIIPPLAEIGYDLKLDRKRFDVTASGISIVAKKSAIT